MGGWLSTGLPTPHASSLLMFFHCTWTCCPWITLEWASVYRQMSPKSISAAPDPCPLLATRLPGSLTLMASSLSPASLFRPVPPPVSLSHRARPPPLPSSAPLPPKALSILLLYAVCSLFRVPAQASSKTHPSRRLNINEEKQTHVIPEIRNHDPLISSMFLLF